MDILLNHTSFDSEWLLSSPDSYYNIDNTPHLAPALVLDQAIMKFSNQLAMKSIQKYPKGNVIENEEDLSLISQILWDDVFLPLKIPDYFKFNILSLISLILSEFKLKYPNTNAPPPPTTTTTTEEIDLNALINELDRLKTRFGVSNFGLNIEIPSFLVFLSSNPIYLTSISLEKAMSILNARYEAMAYDFLSQALNNMKGTIRYHIISLHNNLISPKNTLVSNYFTILKNGKAAANNGWIINADPLEDFAQSNLFHYLRRTIIIWGDLVKLRYGATKSDSPYLWKHMKLYVRKMAGMFHGFRLDNAHSTPLHIGEYLMRKARKDNTDLLIVSELFTGNSELDALFTKRIGFNGLVREAQRVIYIDYIYINHYISVGIHPICQIPLIVMVIYGGKQ